MSISEDCRDYAYKVLVQNEKGLSDKKLAVLRTLDAIKEGTSFEIAQAMRVEINQVTGRIKDLCDDGLVVALPKIFHEETNCWRTVWRVAREHEQSTQNKRKPFLLSNEFAKAETILRKLNSFGDNPQAEHQRKLLRGMLE